jgi:3-deoxy-manno-octulosonate cytidylyltransferase (CMP-KDO synthetase)
MSSSRFFGKPLMPINGIPLVVRVCQRAETVFDKSKIFVATESDQIAKVVSDHGYQVVMTSDKCQTGTDRISEAARVIGSKYVINLQGDEPLVRAEHLMTVLEAARTHPEVTHNCYAKIETPDEIRNKNVPKVVFGDDRQLIYASRAPIPMGKAQTEQSLGHKQVCIYYFPASDLKLFGESEQKANLESIEDIEILRLVENHRTVLMHELEGPFQAVDEIEDVKKVERLLASGF